MNAPITRRAFVRRSALASAALTFPFVAARNVYGANSRLNIAAIGAGGKGGIDIGYCAGENIVALCDVDQKNAEATFTKFPQAARYKDFRRLFEAQKDIDAVTISTPDHTHFHAAALALQMRKHVYLQKPLTHTVWEARTLTQLARKARVITQMGNQGHSEVNSRRLVELIRSGVLGQVTEVHVWTNRPIWPQGMERPPSKPAPAHLDWDLWLGPAPWRDYHDGCAPFNWRAYWDFGTGALGDMGCHNMDLAFFALDLKDPVAVSAESSGVNRETAPKWSIIRYEFAKRRSQPAMTMTWYDGGKKPNPALAKAAELPENGYIFVGTKDTLYVPSYWGKGSFLSGAKLEDFSSVPVTLPRHPIGEKDNDAAQHLEWIDACKGKGKALANFDYAGPMTEAVLLGNVALRVGKRIEWDAKKLRVKNAPEAASLIRSDYRKGWEWNG